MPSRAATSVTASESPSPGERRQHQQAEQQRARQPRAVRQRLVARGQRAFCRKPAEQARDATSLPGLPHHPVDLRARQLDRDAAAARHFQPPVSQLMIPTYWQRGQVETPLLDFQDSLDEHARARAASPWLPLRPAPARPARVRQPVRPRRCALPDGRDRNTTSRSGSACAANLGAAAPVAGVTQRRSSPGAELRRTAPGSGRPGCARRSKGRDRDRPGCRAARAARPSTGSRRPRAPAPRAPRSPARPPTQAARTRRATMPRRRRSPTTAGRCRAVSARAPSGASRDVPLHRAVVEALVGDHPCRCAARLGGHRVVAGKF